MSIKINRADFRPDQRLIYIAGIIVDANDDDPDTKRLYDLLMELAEKGRQLQRKN